MYHIKDDRRACASAQRIYQALIGCLKGKSFDRITVSDLQKASGISRSTFYRHFDTITDILHMRCDQCFHEVLSGYISSMLEKNGKGLLSYFFDYWSRNTEILDILISINQVNLIYECHLKNSDIITRAILPAVDTTTEEYRYFMALRTGVMLGYLQAWISTGKRKKPDELASLVTRQFRMALQNEILL